MCKILYIDDDINHGLFFKKICEKRKVICDTVTSLIEASSLLENNQYDIYITDFLLGGYTGKDVIDKYPDKGWFLITSLTEDLIPEYIKQDSRITEILYKPITVGEVLQIIDNYISCKK